MARILSQRYPQFKIEGDHYPPPQYRATIASFVSAIKFAAIIVAVSGIDPFSLMDIPTPRLVSFCLMCFIVGNLVEGQLVSTGAFEIYLNDVPLWSKLKSERMPRLDELVQSIDAQLQFKPNQITGQSPQRINVNDIEF